MGERVIFHRQTLLFAGILLGAAVIAGFAVWATRTEQRIADARSKEASEMLKAGWKVVRTEKTTRKFGDVSGDTITLTLERSNWDRLWH